MKRNKLINDFMLRRKLRKSKIKFLNGNLVKAASGRYTAYFDEFPEIIAEGENEENAKENLILALKEVLKYRKELSQDRSTSQNYKPTIPTKRFELPLA
jgi:predicted RNase H-like HicB family nuclease